MTIDLRPWLEAVPDGAANAVAAARHALVVCHENPDADTLGAAIGVEVIVERHGGRATLISTDPVPPLYGFLDGMDRFRTDPDPGGDYDLLVVCDCGTLDRVGAVRDRHRDLFDRLPRVIIDHHASTMNAGPTDWVDPAAAATCELVALLADLESGGTPAEDAAPIRESLPTPAGAASPDVPEEGSGESRSRGRRRPAANRRGSENRPVRGDRQRPRGRS